jgi:predicted short-subunit dehydrogenase-like oxidoreductase (DUF2520 family)
MKDFKVKNICIVGAGRVGTTVGYLLANKNLPGLMVKSIASKSLESLNRAKKILGTQGENILYSQDNIESAGSCNVILICTPDDVIEKVCEEIARTFSSESGPEEDLEEIKNNYKNDKRMIFIHFSGSKSLKVLKSAEKAGALTASIHPLKSFASIENAIKTLSGTVFGLTSSNNFSKKIASHIVKILGGTIIEVEDSKKPLYHAAACVASNYLVSLINYAVKIHEGIGIEADVSLKGLMGLIEGTIDNIKNLGTKKSLTGPIARGDVGTIEEHLENFYKYFAKEDAGPYKAMGIETSRLAFENKWITKEVFDKFEELFKESLKDSQDKGWDGSS